MTRKLLPIALLALLSGCPSEEEEAADLKPIEITVATATGQPATPTNPAIEPAVAYDGTRVHLVYCQHDGSGNHNLMYTARVGAGSFASPAPLHPASAGDSRKPHCCLDTAGTLHVVWEEGTSPNRDIWYVTINAVGTISTATPLTATPEDEASPRVHVDASGRVHAVWQGIATSPSPSSAVFYRRTQAGLFLPAVILPKVNAGQPAEMPDITTDAFGRVYAVWAEQNGTSRDIRMVRSDDNGANFGHPPGGTGFVASGSVDLTFPRVAGGKDGEVFLAYLGQDSQGDRAVFATFTQSGYSMASPGQLASSATGGLRDLAIAAFHRGDDKYNVFVAFNDGGPTGGNIVVRASHNNGANFPGKAKDLSQGSTQPASNRLPAIALDDNELIAAWEAQPQGGGVVRIWQSTNSYKLPKK
ncbi:MAG: hypothetical protein KF696_02360 [Planctomycetes bacterium]|nr:hypothetical protein [Planctomycetota bacterium]MCW8134845.1 hypothetical protein [Planctomycetota bacterium]